MCLDEVDEKKCFLKFELKPFDYTKSSLYKRRLKKNEKKN